jgi:hypothetical protein
MENISKVNSTENTAQNGAVTSPKTTEAKSGDASGFETLLRSMIQPSTANQANEEEMFASLVYERIKSEKGEGVAKQYADLLAGEKTSRAKADGYIPLEDAAKGALKSLRDSGAITSQEADQVYSEAFEAAQLDANTELLYDGRGGAGDTTIALAELESALSRARLMTEKFDSGASKATARSLDIEGSASTLLSSPNAIAGTPGDPSLVPLTNDPQGTVFDGPQGFLFKPESSTDSKLAVLLPEELSQQVLSLLVKDSNGNTLEEGRSTGYGELGIQEKFAFTKAGSEYGSNVTVQALLNDGTTREWRISDPSQRYD